MKEWLISNGAAAMPAALTLIALFFAWSSSNEAKKSNKIAENACNEAKKSNKIAENACNEAEKSNDIGWLNAALAVKLHYEQVYLSAMASAKDLEGFSAYGCALERAGLADEKMKKLAIDIDDFYDKKMEKIKSL